MKIKIITVLATLILVGGSVGYYLYSSRTSEVPAMPAAVAVTEFPTIQNQDVNYLAEEGPGGVLSSPSVQTVGGATIELKLLKQLPWMGIYQYGSGLYAYDRKTYTFTYLKNSDAASFESVQNDMQWEVFSRDKVNVYCNGLIMEDIDTATFEMIPDFYNSEYLKRSPTSKYVVSTSVWPQDGKVYVDAYYTHQDKDFLYTLGKGPAYCENVGKIKRQ